MSDNKTKVVVKFPVLFILFLTFMVLKLTKVIAWSWWWVTAPLWIPVGILLGFLMFCGLAMLIGLAFSR